MAAAAGNLLQTALEFGLNEHEYGLIIQQLQREPTYTELGMYAVMWSEHCGYKYSRPVLAYFKKYKEALAGAGHENAGIIELGDGLGVTFKIESHNHPSAVEPYQGAATGVGGILRDIFTMGARPIASLNSLRFGPLAPDENTSAETATRNRYLFDHVVKGIGGYGNCVGVPTVGGEVGFHWRYSGNPLVNAMAIGLVESSKITTAGAAGVGNPVVYLGSSTGKDGIHGASFASQVLDEASESKRPNVQIGDPFAEKLLIEATLEALETGAIVAIQDMGAAGLTCSTIEMSAKGRVGMEVNLDLVPAREEGMSAYELMLSESQERMLCVTHPGREREVIDIFEKWGLHAVVIGTVISDQVVRVRRFGKLECELFPPHLADQCPTYQVTPKEPDYYRAAKAFTLEAIADRDWDASLKILLSHPNIASKRFVFEQYDSEVQTQTIVRPGGGDAAVLSPHFSKKGVAVSVDGNALWTYFDPYAGGVLAVCEAARNVACSGAKPAGITDGLNFGNPEDPEVFWQFERAVKGIADAAEGMQTPVVSGNVSFYNESEIEGAKRKTEVLPTPIIGMIGILEEGQNPVPMWIQQEGLKLGLVYSRYDSPPQQGLGASLYLSAVHGVENGVPTCPSISKEKDLCEWLNDAANAHALQAAHDISEGGFAVALAEMCFEHGIGVKVEIGFWQKYFSRNDAALFGELPTAVIVAYDQAYLSVLEELAQVKELEFSPIGEATGTQLLVNSFGETLLSAEVVDLRELFEGSVPNLLASGSSDKSPK